MSNETILVVTNESTQAIEIQNLLRAQGYEVPLIANNGRDALRSAKEIGPDLVLMSIELNGDWDGIETANAMRKEQAVPVIYLTSRTDEKTLSRAKASAPYGIIPRPFSPSELFFSVEMALYRHQLELKVQQNETRFRRVIDQAADAILVHDLNGKLIEVNRWACQTLGYTRDELLTMSVGDIETNFVPGRMAARWHNIPASQPITIQGRQKRKDGTTFPVEVRVAQFDRQSDAPDDNGQRLVLAIARDISERESIRQELEKSSARLSSVVETNADAITVVETSGRISFANSAAQHIFGLEHSEILRRHHDDERWQIRALDGSPLPPDALPVARVLQNQMPITGIEFSQLRPDGRRILVSVNASPLYESIPNTPSDKSNENSDEEALQVLAGKVLTGVICSTSDITQRKALEERLTHQALHDVLTGLPNRALFYNRLEQALARADRSQHEVAVLFIDLDNFKFVNDSLGHSAGDRLLVSVAQRLGQCLRATDTAARFGGDEFVILLDEVSNPASGQRVIDRIMQALREPYEIEGRSIFATPSIGIAFSRDRNSNKPNHPNELLRHADTAMYAAKARGKGCYQVFQDGMNQVATTRLETEADLRKALENNEFRLQYQPKVDLDSGHIYGVEALVRWQHSTRGLVSPLDFLPLAEETGLMVPIGLWVLEHACQQARKWQLSHPKMPPFAMDTNVYAPLFQNQISASPIAVREEASAATKEAVRALELNVNLSARQLQSPDLVSDIKRILKQSGLPPQSLVLEITESVIMEESTRTGMVLRQLKDLGVRIAIDDFGTGYSSLGYLHSFPIDSLKIDRRFITNLHEANGASVIVASMINMAHALDLTVVAEGAENMGEIECLQHLGCDIAQGFFFAHPMDAADIETWMQSSQKNTQP